MCISSLVVEWEGAEGAEGADGAEDAGQVVEEHRKCYQVTVPMK